MRRWSGRRPDLEREWLDRLGTVAGRADELCRYAVLFGDPQLAFSAIGRILDVTAGEVQAVAAARLRPDNRAVLEYEPMPPQDAAAPVASGQEPSSEQAPSSEQEEAGQ